MAVETAGKEKRQYQLNCIEDALLLLNLLFGTDGGMTLTELYLASGLSKNKTFRLLTTFERNGVLAKDQQGKYGPGISTVVAVRKIISRGDSCAAIRPVLETVAGQLNEAAYLASRIDGQAVLIDMVDCSQSVRVRSFIGHTIGCRTVRSDPVSQSCCGVRDGVTVTVGGIDPEITTLSIDIVTITGRIAGALVVIAPTYRMSPERIVGEVIPALHETVRHTAQILTAIPRRRTSGLGRWCQNELSKDHLRVGRCVVAL